MANATATQAYTAVRAVEQAQHTNVGYVNHIPMAVAVQKIIDDNVDVTTYAEGLAGVFAAVGANVHQNLGYLDTGVAADKLYVDAQANFVFSGIDA